MTDICKKYECHRPDTEPVDLATSAYKSASSSCIFFHNCLALNCPLSLDSQFFKVTLTGREIKNIWGKYVCA